ncbi:thioredoxin-like domain-containing protein [Bernardetia sp.]|uniref:thioredoxin-like domain-containing protein n=1 Tax=Bernardetia sp. TaxID=1937974 RepID=UPI0025BBA0CE|nr:thioredoxin-like domain-containing protein [Bernardetia sp.]
MKTLFFPILILLFFISCNEKSTSASELDKEKKIIKISPKYMVVPPTNAPEIDTKFGWVNTEKSYKLADFKGKIVLLDFWTFGCINCQHIIPDLEKLEQEFENELVVIGVHSAKFSAEQSTQRIRQAALKFGVHHPVVNDADMKVWQSYGIRAWPTLTLISPEGKVVWQRAGEKFYEDARSQIMALKVKHKDILNSEKFEFQLAKAEKKELMFPSKIIRANQDDKEPAFWIADSGNNRVLKINLEGKVLETIGNGKKGNTEGSFENVEFYEPHGLALSENGKKLYIADTKNNVIKEADVENKTVKTIAGTGEMSYYFGDKKWGENVNPNSPWDLLIDKKYPNTMYIASAGNHQILRMNLQTNQVERFAGSGREQLTDGDDFKKVAFNQPSGLTQAENFLYVADSEASAIRQIDLQKKEVRTLVGSGLFDFGDTDGTAQKAVLQHPVGILHDNNKVYIADTYNGKVKVLDLEKNRVKTLISGLSEPNDVLLIGDYLYISDTNNHQILRVNTKTFEKEVIL